MLFLFLTVLVMAAIAYAQFKEGVFTSFVMLVNVMIAGVVACNFFEPLADLMADITKGTFMQGTEDFIMLVLLFLITLTALRFATNNIAPTEIEFHPILFQAGSILCALLTGYVLVGFFVVAMQTLPLDEHFMGFEAEVTTEPSYQYLHRSGSSTADKRETAGEKRGGEMLRRIFPPDRIWLAMMQRASYGSLGNGDRSERNGFDPQSNFPLRYERYRRYGDPSTKSEAKPWDEVLPAKPGIKQNPQPQ
jgi:hypothetical protein